MITASELTNLTAAGESETIEFKESFSDEALETVGAFSNALGGTLLIGVKDSGDICGLQVGKKSLEDIANRIQDATDPRLQPSLALVQTGKKTVLVITVAAGTRAPVSIRGRYFRRSGRTNQRMSHEEIMQRMVANTGLSWDAAVEPLAKLSDLDPEKMDHFISLVKKARRRPVPEETSAQELLRKIELLKEDRPTRAAVLLFGKNPDSFFSSAFLKIGRFRSPVLIVDDREVHGSLFNQVDEAMLWFRDRLTTEFIISGKPERDVRWEYPLAAIREAVVNAVCHRDYSSAAHSQIRLYDDKLEIWNAGGLPPSLTAETLLQEHDSVPRNRKIAEAFFYAGIIERWGSGTLRIVSELAAAGLPQPRFESEPDRFRIAFDKDLFTEDRLRKMKLSERQLKAISFTKERGVITNTDYQEIAEVSKRTATRELNTLVSKGIFVAQGNKGRGASYRIKGP